MDSIEYRGVFSAEDFLALANRVWPRDYDLDRAREALTRTMNIGAWDGSYQRRGIGRELMRRALEHAARGTLFFGAQPQSVEFFERIGCTRGPIGFVLRRPPS